MQNLLRYIKDDMVPPGLYLSDNGFVTTQATTAEIDTWLADNATWDAALAAYRRFQFQWREWMYEVEASSDA